MNLRTLGVICATVAAELEREIGMRVTFLPQPATDDVPHDGTLCLWSTTGPHCMVLRSITISRSSEGSHVQWSLDAFGFVAFSRLPRDLVAAAL